MPSAASERLVGEVRQRRSAPRASAPAALRRPRRRSGAPRDASATSRSNRAASTASVIEPQLVAATVASRAPRSPSSGEQLAQPRYVESAPSWPRSRAGSLPHRPSIRLLDRDGDVRVQREQATAPPAAWAHPASAAARRARPRPDRERVSPSRVLSLASLEPADAARGQSRRVYRAFDRASTGVRVARDRRATSKGGQMARSAHAPRRGSLPVALIAAVMVGA